MNNVVNQLLEVDQQARQLLDEAQQYYDNTVVEIAREKERITAMYRERADERIAQVEQTESQRVDEDVSAATARSETLIHNMEEIYNQKHLEWEEDLYRRCIGQ